MARPRSSDGATNPVAGNHCRSSANSATKIIAIQKLGNATPTELSSMVARSAQPPDLAAARMPMGTPISTEISMA